MEKIKYLILIASTLLTSIAQMTMKLGANAIDTKKTGIFEILLAYIMSPLVVLGFALSAVAAIMWTYCLSKFDFSAAVFIASISYIFVLIISITVFKEAISPSRWIGCGFIMVGIFFVLRS